MNNFIKVVNQTEAFHFTFENLVSFHGKESIAGVALAYQGLKFFQEELLSSAPIVRGDFIFETTFSGQGVKDAVDMISRAVSYSQYNLLTPEDVQEYIKECNYAINGQPFYFKAIQKDAYCIFTVKKEIFCERSKQLALKKFDGSINQEEYAEMIGLREKAAMRVINDTPQELFHIIEFKKTGLSINNNPLFYSPETSETVTVIDYRIPISIQYSSLVAYNGALDIAGVTLAYQLFVQAQKAGFSIVRGETQMYLKGKQSLGVADTIEFVLRPTLYKLPVNELNISNNQERFVYQLKNSQNSITLKLKSEFYPPENILENKKEAIDFAHTILTEQELFEIIQ